MIAPGGRVALSTEEEEVPDCGAEYCGVAEGDLLFVRELDVRTITAR